MATQAALRWLRSEFDKVLRPAGEALRRRQWRRFWLAGLAALLVIGLACAFRTPRGHAFVEEYAITRPADGWGTVALRLPLSMFAPAALLPFWFAVVQVALVYGAAQAILGWWRTVLVAAVGHTLATCSAHGWILLGRPLGVGHGYDNFGDAGPSVAVVTLIAYIAVVRCAGWLAVVLVAYDAIELTVFNGLSQREHLLGAVVGALCAAAVLAVRRSGLAVRRTGGAAGRDAANRAAAGRDAANRAAAGRNPDGPVLAEPVPQALSARAR